MFMGGGGSIQGMNTSLKNNRQMLKRSSFFPKKKSFLERRKEYLRAAEGVIDVKKASPEELQIIRYRIIGQRRKKNALTAGIALVLLPFFIYFFIQLLKTEDVPLSDEAEQTMNAKINKFQFFLDDGDKYLKNGQWHNAIFQYTKAKEIFPANYEASYRLAYAYTYRCRNRQEDCEKADSLTRRLLNRNPEDVDLKELLVVLEFVDR